MATCHFLWSAFVVRAVGFFAVIIKLWAFTAGKKLLSDSVRYYEFLDYPYVATHRVRKSAHLGAEEHAVILDFSSHGRTFRLGLKHDDGLFADDLLMAAHGDEMFPKNDVYIGKIIGEAGSAVHGFIHNDIFEGRIYCQDGEVFDVESSKQYDGDHHNRGHSVIYNLGDVVHGGPYYYGVANSKGDSATESSKLDDLSDKKDDVLSIEAYPLKIPENLRHDRRFRRAVTARRPPSMHNLECHIEVRADSDYVASQGGDVTRAMHTMSQHVKFVQNMLLNTDFDRDGYPDGYTVVIKKIGVIGTTKCDKNDTCTDCKIRDRRVGVAKLLDIVSTSDHSQFCLSYVFTHRNFDQGILGLTFTGFPDKKSPGGICEKYQKYNDGRKKTLNTGVVSNVVYDRLVMKKETDITLAHEISHNFGARHDDKGNPACVPHGPNGNFLMYSQAQEGMEENNLVLSPCSKSAMLENIRAKRDLCFLAKGTAVCGNRIVEPGEDCDCGYQSEESCHRYDPCCQGASSDEMSGCTWSTRALGVPAASRCSPSQGDCCDSVTCRPYPNNTKICSEESEKECTRPSKCISTSPQCQAHEKIADRSYCNGNANVCIGGACIGSLCILHNKVDCQCTDEPNLCNICCRDPGNASSCAVTKINSNSETTPRPAGSPCNEGAGRCDRRSKCQLLNEDGVLGRLRRWLFSQPSFINIYEWARGNWWACVLMGLGIVLLVIGFVYCCQFFVPTDGKRRHPTGRPFLCVNAMQEGEGECTRTVSPSAPSHTSSRNYVRTPTSEPPMYDDPPPGYGTAVRGIPPPVEVEMRYPPSYEMELLR